MLTEEKRTDFLAFFQFFIRAADDTRNRYDVRSQLDFIIRNERLVKDDDFASWLERIAREDARMSNARVAGFVSLLVQAAITLLAMADGPWAEWGLGVGLQFREPRSLAADQHGNIYVVDAGSHLIHKLSEDGQPLARWGGRGIAPDLLRHPSSIALDTEGRVYVLDGGYFPGRSERVQQLSPDGQLLARWPSEEECEKRRHVLVGIAVGHDGRVYVADDGNCCIFVLSAGMNVQGVWGAWNPDAIGGGLDGLRDQLHKFGYPTPKVLPRNVGRPSALASAPDGTIYLADRKTRLFQLSPDGDLLEECSFRNGVGFPIDFSVDGIAVGGDGTIILAGSRLNGLVLSPANRGWATIVPRSGDIGSRPRRGEFRRPSGVAIDVHGNIYVADTGNRCVQKLSANGFHVATWGERAPESWRCESPSGVAVDPAGNVYVLDRESHRIRKFASNGILLANWGSRGDGLGEFQCPEGIAVDSGGNVYIADSGNFRIQKLSQVGEILAEWGEDHWGESLCPKGVAVDSQGNLYMAVPRRSIVKLTPEGRIDKEWVAGGRVASEGIACANDRILAFDDEDGTVIEFSPSGDLQAVWPQKSAVHFWGAKGVALDRDGNIYVADTDRDRITKITLREDHKAWCTDFVMPTELSSPEGIAVDAKGDVYVADTGHHRLLKIPKEAFPGVHWYR